MSDTNWDGKKENDCDWRLEAVQAAHSETL